MAISNEIKAADKYVIALWVEPEVGIKVEIGRDLRVISACSFLFILRQLFR